MKQILLLSQGFSAPVIQPHTKITFFSQDHEFCHELPPPEFVYEVYQLVTSQQDFPEHQAKPSM